jgi:Transposase
MVTCGIDWAQDHHDIAIVDAEGRRVAKRRIPESVAGLTELTAMLAEAGDDPKDPIPVAIEIPRGLLVPALRAGGRPIYPINPMSVARYRERSRWQRSTRCLPAPNRPTGCRARSPTTVMPSRWPTSCAPTPTSIAGCPPTPNWRNRSPCWPGASGRHLAAQPGR